MGGDSLLMGGDSLLMGSDSLLMGGDSLLTGVPCSCGRRQYIRFEVQQQCRVIVVAAGPRQRSRSSLRPRCQPVSLKPHTLHPRPYVGKPQAIQLYTLRQRKPQANISTPYTHAINPQALHPKPLHTKAYSPKPNLGTQNPNPESRPSLRPGWQPGAVRSVLCVLCALCL